MKYNLGLILILAVSTVFGQVNVISGTTFIVKNGTTLSLDPSQADSLFIASGASVVNHGEINFGDSSFISEQPGSPVTGSGFESFFVPSGNYTGNPANLGLDLTTGISSGGFTIERWHSPLSDGNGNSSIARVFVFNPDQSFPTTTFDFHYDQTEVGSLTESSLIAYNRTAAGNWVNYGGIVNTASNILQSAGGTGFFEITLMDVVNASVSENQEQNYLRVFPNPAMSFVKVGTTGSGEIIIQDQLGRVVYKRSTGTGLHEIDVTNFESGLYLVQWSTSQIRETKKLIIQH